MVLSIQWPSEPYVIYLLPHHSLSDTISYLSSLLQPQLFLDRFLRTSRCQMPLCLCTVYSFFLQHSSSRYLNVPSLTFLVSQTSSSQQYPPWTSYWILQPSFLHHTPTQPTQCLLPCFHYIALTTFQQNRVHWISNMINCKPYNYPGITCHWLHIYEYLDFRNVKIYVP